MRRALWLLAPLLAVSAIACGDEPAAAPVDRSSEIAEPPAPRREREFERTPSNSRTEPTVIDATEPTVIDAAAVGRLAGDQPDLEVARVIVARREEFLPLLLQVLVDGSSVERRGAVAALVLMPREAIAAVGPWLTDDDPMRRARGAQVIRWLSDWWVPRPTAEEIVSGLVDGLPAARSGEACRRLGALAQAGPLASRGLEAIRERLASTDPAVVRYAAYALESIGPAAREATLELWRTTAVFAGDSSTISTLETALRSLGADDACRDALLDAIELADASTAERIVPLLYRESFEEDDWLEAMYALGAAGLTEVVRITAPAGGQLRHPTREHVRTLGDAAAAVLRNFRVDEDPQAIAWSLDLLAASFPADGVDTFTQRLAHPEPTVRAAAARGCAAAFRAGVEQPDALPELITLLDDGPDVRAAALHAVAAIGRVPQPSATQIRADLDHPDPRVRIAAAEAVFTITGETDRPLAVLRAELVLPAPEEAWLHRRATRTEDDFTPGERAWVETVRVIACIGPPAAPLAEDVVWAALRHGGLRLQSILIESVHTMGAGAEPAIPLLQQLARTRGFTLADYGAQEALDRALAACLTDLGAEVPDPPSDF